MVEPEHAGQDIGKHPPTVLEAHNGVVGIGIATQQVLDECPCVGEVDGAVQPDGFDFAALWDKIIFLAPPED